MRTKLCVFDKLVWVYLFPFLSHSNKYLYNALWCIDSLSDLRVPSPIQSTKAVQRIIQTYFPSKSINEDILRYSLPNNS